MNVFQLIKTVLDDEYDLIPGSKAARDAEVKTQLDELEGAYENLTDAGRPGIDYSLPSKRFAYIYKYTTCHADIVARKIAEVEELRAVFMRDGWANVACIGGGPGSDFLGAVKYMTRRRSCTSLKCYLLDKEPSWGDTWCDVDQRTDGFDFRVSTHSQVLDVIAPGSWESQTRYLRADLFTFVYFVSEVWKLRPNATGYFEHLFAKARRGSLFLFIDNDHQWFWGYFDEIAIRAGLERRNGKEEFFQTDTGEEKKDLNPYYDKYRKLGHSPKLGAKIAWRVYRKP